MTKPSTKLHPMIAQQIANAGIRLAQIDAVAAHLADLMREAHGREFRIQVEHEVGLIVIARKLP